MVFASKKIDVILITLFLLAAALIVFTVHPSYLASALIFFLPSCLYLSFRMPKNIKAIGVFSFLYSVPLVLVVDYLATASGAWLETTIFPVKVLGVVPIETFIWVLFTYLTLMFYQHFFRSSDEVVRIHSRATYLISFLWLLAVAVVILHFVHPMTLVVKYYYAKLVVVAFILPLTFTFLSIPNVAKNITVQSLYFALASVLAELAFLSAGSWSFPGKYLITVQMLGHTVPLEELAWLVLCVPTVLCGYEYFANKRGRF